jgi:hypothetical protein
MVKSRAVQAKASRTWGIEEHSSSQAGSVVMPDPVCGSRGAKTANSNLRCRSQGRDSPVSNGRTSTTRGNFAPSPSAAGVSKFSRDVIRGPLKELSESELNTGIVHVGFSSRKAASVTRPSTSAKARQSIAEAQSYEWGQQNVMAGSSPSSENTFSVQHAMDLAQQAVDAFKTPPGKALSARQGQGSPGSSIGGSARSIKVKFVPKNALYRNIILVLIDLIVLLRPAVLHARRHDSRHHRQAVAPDRHSLSRRQPQREYRLPDDSIRTLQLLVCYRRC